MLLQLVILFSMLLVTNLIVYLRARKVRSIPIENPLEMTSSEEGPLQDLDISSTGRTPNKRPQRRVLRQLDGDVEESQRMNFPLSTSPYLHRKPLFRVEKGETSGE